MNARASWLFLPGAGGGRSLWEPLAATRDGLIAELPVADRVEDLVDGACAAAETLPRPRVIAGNSLGALVALEASRKVPVDGLLLIAAGWQMAVDEDRIAGATSAPEEFYLASANRTVGELEGGRHVETILRDFRSRPPQALGRHLRAIKQYQPRKLESPPPSIVIRGGLDRSVSLRSQIELASELGGVLAVLPNGSHMPIVDCGEEILRYMTMLEIVAVHAAGKCRSA